MRKVLVVDDDADLLDMVEMALGLHGLNVKCIKQGARLFDTIQEHCPDVILMDIYLGDSDGRELCLKLKNTNQYQNIPVILYSAGYITNSSVIASKADDFIVKPFDIGQLIEKINSVV